MKHSKPVHVSVIPELEQEFKDLIEELRDDNWYENFMKGPESMAMDFIIELANCLQREHKPYKKKNHNRQLLKEIRTIIKNEEIKVLQENKLLYFFFKHLPNILKEIDKPDLSALLKAVKKEKLDVSGIRIAYKFLIFEVLSACIQKNKRHKHNNYALAFTQYILVRSGFSSSKKSAEETKSEKKKKRKEQIEAVLAGKNDASELIKEYKKNIEKTLINNKKRPSVEVVNSLFKLHKIDFT